MINNQQYTHAQRFTNALEASLSMDFVTGKLLDKLNSHQKFGKEVLMSS